MNSPETTYYLSARAVEPVAGGLWVHDTGLITGQGISHWQWCTDYVCLHVVTAGRGTVRAAGETRKVQAGDMFWLWPGVTVEYFKDPDWPWNVYWAHLIGPMAIPFGRACGMGPETICARPVDPAAAIASIRRIFHLFQRKRADRAPYRVISLLYRFCDACPQHEPSPAASAPDNQGVLVARARQFIATAPQPVKGVTELAAALHVSRTTLFMAFKKVLGQSPIQCIAEARVARAKELLGATPQSLAAVARQCGFNGPKYFLRCFRRQTGQTPSQWRAHCHRR
ncbi:MAG: AraC family transcriptional regulator [Lentisphaeria bacterium]